jgi:Protein of unknown function (DUF3685)
MPEACRFSLLGCVHGSKLVTRKIRVRRTSELNTLTGWKAHLCTAMELADVLAPLLAAMLDRISRVLSWLLVSLIGRGLGLVYKGIRQSMSVQANAPRQQQAQQRSAGPDSDDPLFYGFG